MNSKNNLALTILLYAIIAFLFFYHSSKLYNIYLGEDFMNSDNFLNSFAQHISAKTIVTIQSAFRISILISLLLININKRIGLIGMWFGIGLLVLSQFWLVTVSNSEEVYAMFSGLRPLKGFILPTIITLLSIKRSKIK